MAVAEPHDNAAMIAIAGHYKYLAGGFCDITAPPLPARHHIETCIENLKRSTGGECLLAEFPAVLYIDLPFKQVLRCNAEPLQVIDSVVVQVRAILYHCRD